VFLFWPVIVLIAALAAPVQAAETANLRYHVLTRDFDAFEQLDPELRNKVRLAVRIVTHAGNTRPVMLWINHDGKRYDLPIDDYGFVELLRSPEIVADDPLVETNQPKGSISTKLAMLLQVPDSQRFHYADLRAATAQTDALIDKAAGLASFLIPTVKGVQFRCAAASDCLLVVHHPTGDEILRPNDDGMIRLRLNHTLDSENPLIEAPRPVTVIEPLLD
jgi:hypothetical protein